MKEIILLDSFLEQAIHKFLDKLMLHVRMDRSANSNREELDDLQPSFMAMCSLAGKLWTRTTASEQQMSESTSIRLHMYNFLSTCFANFFKVQTLSGDSDFVWTLVCPNSSPKEVAEMFLSLSSKISHFGGGNISEPKPSLKPGESWYSMLLFLLAQLSIGMDQKEPTVAVLEAFELVDPSSSVREKLYPSLWAPDKNGSSAVSKFDEDWVSMYSQAESQQTNELCELYPPPRFCKMMEVYLRSVSKLLDPPVLNLYYNMRESSHQLPPAFFESPQDTLANNHNSYHSPALEPESVMGSSIDMSPSPNALAEYSERMSRSIIRHGQDIQPPPALDFSKLQSKQDNGRKDVYFGDGMTTPTNQVEKPKYISSWGQGDIEGGGQPHRRRSLDYHGDDMVDCTPPPQTLLSPRNLAAAQKRNNDATAEELLEREANGGDMSISSVYDGQVTPEHQIGSAADPIVKSASRYVESRREGDTEGGGRKRRKHHPPGGPLIPRIFNR